MDPAAFGRLCVETFIKLVTIQAQIQPPSGGCVLKPDYVAELETHRHPAAFGRLCVETMAIQQTDKVPCQPPSGGCVLKLFGRKTNRKTPASRLRAAVC